MTKETLIKKWPEVRASIWDELEKSGGDEATFFFQIKQQSESIEGASECKMIRHGFNFFSYLNALIVLIDDFHEAFPNQQIAKKFKKLSVDDLQAGDDNLNIIIEQFGRADN
jgi:hypothetical protein